MSSVIPHNSHLCIHRGMTLSKGLHITLPEERELGLPASRNCDNKAGPFISLPPGKPW